ncbi:MAG: hypothetical protein KDA64_04475, partial [Rhodospirillaceae bacterium]|nr:hypothetical protein [Rhodospirillaceae bacterium]
RRIPYKLEIGNPNREGFVTVFQMVASAKGLELTEETIQTVVDWLEEMGMPLAFYQPKYITDQVLSACKYEGVPAAYSRQYVVDALDNLYMRTTSSSQKAQVSPLRRIN